MTTSITVTVVWRGLGSDQSLERAPFDTDEERAAYLDLIRADLLRRGYLDLDRRQREDDQAEAWIEERRP